MYTYKVPNQCQIVVLNFLSSFTFADEEKELYLCEGMQYCTVSAAFECLETCKVVSVSCVQFSVICDPPLSLPFSSLTAW